MAPRTPIRAAALAGLVSCLMVCAPGWAPAPGDSAAAADRAAEGQTQIVIAASDSGSRSLALGIGKSVVIDFPRDIKDVLVADPKIANAVIRSSRRAYIIGVASGATNIFFFDVSGKQMADFEITVSGAIKTPPSRDVSAIENAIHKYVPGASDVKVESVGDGIILSGTVANQLQAQQAYDIASHFVDPGDAFSNGGGAGGNGGGSSGNSFSMSMSQSSSPLPSAKTLNGASSSKIVNLIVVLGRDQVMLKVTVAEMDRTVIKQLGINLNGSFGAVNLNNASLFPVNGALSTVNSFNQYGVPLASLVPLVQALGAQPNFYPYGNAPNSPSGLSGTFRSATANLQAMEQAGVVRTLAEPTLTAISGEAAHFLAGGSFPYPSVQSCSVPPCPPTIQFQPFGVSLTFSPLVLSEGRISLNMMTEVSELNPANSVTVAGTTVPGLSVRRADTTVEISSGGTLAIAGMLQEETKQTISGLPGVMEVPILGTLFKSRDYLNGRTELVILVTPYVVRAVAQKDLSRPDDGFADSSDPAAVLLGRLNRIYGVGGVTDPPDNYRGKYGFILD